VPGVVPPQGQDTALALVFLPLASSSAELLGQVQQTLARNAVGRVTIAWGCGAAWVFSQGQLQLLLLPELGLSYRSLPEIHGFEPTLSNPKNQGC